MKSIQILFLMIVLIGCGKTKTSTQKKTTEVTNQNTQSSPTNLEASNLGPTGQADPIDQYTDPGTGTGITYYDEDPNTPSDPLNEVCGTLYKELNDQTLYFDTVNQQRLIVLFDNNNLDNSSIPGRLNFPNDSYNTCFRGIEQNDSVFIQSVTSMSMNTNPSRINTNHTFNYCGEFKLVTDNSNSTYIQVKYNGIDYRINNLNNLATPAMPHMIKNDGNMDFIQGCVAFDRAPYTNYQITFKKFIDALSFDFGVLSN